MELGTTLAVALVMGLVGLAILVVLWPGEKSARKLLGKWGVREPTEDEVAVAMTYLRRRRLWYPWLFLVLPVIPQATGMGASNPDTASTIGGTLLLGGLLAELFAQRPSRGSRREAVLERRAVRDFTPAWMLVVSGVAELAGLGYLATRAHWIPFAVAAGAIAGSWLIVLLAIRRPAAGTRRVDLALRCRSARVALGMGIGTTVMVCLPVHNVVALLAFVVTLAALLAIASPPRELPAIALRAG